MERHVVDGGYVTNYNDPVVGIKPINQKSIETAMSGKKILNFWPIFVEKWVFSD